MATPPTDIVSAARHALKVEYMQPFVDSMKLLFREHLGADLELGKMRLNETGRPAYAISGVVSISGKVVGRAALSFPTNVAGEITKKFAQVDDLDPGMVSDCVGELANIVVGRAKSFMDQQGISISTPTIVHGTDTSITPQRGAPCISIPCVTSLGEIQLDISVVSFNPS